MEENVPGSIFSFYLKCEKIYEILTSLNAKHYEISEFLMYNKRKYIQIYTYFYNLVNCLPFENFIYTININIILTYL